MSARGAAAAREKGPRCLSCFRPASHCLCAGIRRISTETEFVLLMHPRERRKRIGTARLTRLCIKRSRLIQGIDFTRHAEVNALIKDPANHCVVLFPGEHSMAATAARILNEKRLVVFVIDGTWTCAAKILKLSSNLSRLPQIRFQPLQPSAYRGVRKQPAPHCLSTIEAVHALLRELEPRIDGDGMLEVFRTLVEGQEMGEKGA